MRTSIILAACFAVAACGNSGEPQPDPFVATDAPAVQPAQPDSTQASAGSECATTRPAAASEPNIMGVGLGMRLEDAGKLLSCVPGLQYAYQPVREDGRGEGIAPHQIVANRGNDRLEIVAVGPSGDERVIGLRRTMEFAPGSQPTVQALENEALAKYGQLDRTELSHKGPSSTLYRLEEDTPGVDCGRRSEELGFRDNFVHARGSCGLLIRVLVSFDSDNPGLAAKLEILITNMRQAVGYHDAYVRQRDQRQQAFRDQQLRDAETNTPKL